VGGILEVKIEMKKEKLQEIIHEYALWLDSKGRNGKKASLRFDDLQKTDLHGAFLDKADLTGANFADADFTNANQG
jgi:uncharacterized protein YjbI with pentapeptide repeats